MLSSHLDSTLLIGLPLYTILLVTMCWRAIALLSVNSVSWSQNSKKNTKCFCSSSFIIIYSIFLQNSRNILKIACAIGSALFVASDTMIAIDKFYSPINNSSVCMKLWCDLFWMRFNLLTFILHHQNVGLDHGHILCCSMWNFLKCCRCKQTQTHLIHF